eukprot:IDg14180t1
MSTCDDIVTNSSRAGLTTGTRFQRHAELERAIARNAGDIADGCATVCCNLCKRHCNEVLETLSTKQMNQ